MTQDVVLVSGVLKEARMGGSGYTGENSDYKTCAKNSRREIDMQGSICSL